MPRPYSLAVAAVVFAASLGIAAPASANHQYQSTAVCNGRAVKKVQLLDRTREAAVFLKRRTTQHGTIATVSYACLRRGPIRRLGETRSRYAVLAGRFVAYRVVFQSEFNSYSNVHVVDLSTGATVTRARGMPAYPEDEDSSVWEIVLKRNGSVAWIGSNDIVTELAVWKVDRTGSGPQQVDASPRIDRDSLRLSASRTALAWTNDGQTRTAPID
jgi:hypothetical protein